MFSARLTVWSIFYEMAIGDRLRVGPDFPIIILKNNYSGPNSECGLNFQEFVPKVPNHIYKGFIEMS